MDGPASKRHADRRQELDGGGGGTVAARGDDLITLSPQTRYFSDPPTETNESAIRTFWNGQLYTVLGRQDASGAWQLRLWWKPFVTLIWAGGALIALGGALALLGRLCAEGRRGGVGRLPPERLRMSRAVRFAPLVLLVVVVVALVWRPCNSGRHGTCTRRSRAGRCRAFALPAGAAGKARPVVEPISRPDSRTS